MTVLKFLRLANAVSGAVLALTGALTGYFNTLGVSGRPVSIFFASAGVAQLLTTYLIHEIWGPNTTTTT
jgi:hypothetical protein